MFDAWVFICFTGRERGRVYPAKLVRLYHVLTSSKINQLATLQWNWIGPWFVEIRRQPTVRKGAGGRGAESDHRGH